MTRCESHGNLGSRRDRGRQIAVVLTALLILGLLPGCAWSRFSMRPDPTAFNPRMPCKLPENPTVEDVTFVVNQNVDRLESWRASKVKLRANHMPMALEADLAVQRDRHLRMVVRHALGGGDQLDLGCNQEIFWFWARQAKPAGVMYASHDEIDIVRDNLQIPFEPDWLLEALGVTPINPAGLTLEPIAGTRAARLVSHHQLPNGRSIRKTITVDTCHGRVLEQSLWDSSGRVRLAHAEFSNHRIDPESGVVMPHHIQLEWQQADLALSLDLGDVEVNPASMPERMWEMPHPQGYPEIDLREFASRGNPNAVRQTAVRALEFEGTVEDADSETEFLQPRRGSEDEQSEPIDYDDDEP